MIAYDKSWKTFDFGFCLAKLPADKSVASLKNWGGQKQIFSAKPFRLFKNPFFELFIQGLLGCWKVLLEIVAWRYWNYLDKQLSQEAFKNQNPSDQHNSPPPLLRNFEKLEYCLLGKLGDGNVHPSPPCGHATDVFNCWLYVDMPIF